MNPTLAPDAPEPPNETAWATASGTYQRWFLRDDQLSARFVALAQVSAGQRWWEFSRNGDGMPRLTMSAPVAWEDLTDLADPDAGDFGPLLSAPASALQMSLNHEAIIAEGGH